MYTYTYYIYATCIYIYIYIYIKYINLCQDFNPEGNHLFLHDRHQAPEYSFWLPVY